MFWYRRYIWKWHGNILISYKKFVTDKTCRSNICKRYIKYKILDSEQYSDKTINKSEIEKDIKIKKDININIYY